MDKYNCTRCDDCGKLARYGDKSKGEPHLVKSFCTCNRGKYLKHVHEQEQEQELEPCVFCGELVDASEIDERCEAVICDSRECNTKYAKIQGGVN